MDSITPAVATEKRKVKKVSRKRKLPESVAISEKLIAEKDVDALAELEPERVKTKLHVKKVTKRKERFRERIEKKIRAEILNKEDEGNLVTEEGRQSYFVRQKDILEHVDMATASKHFNLDLDHGPYKVDYSLNGRHLLLGGKSGHIAAFDWLTKQLHAEIQVTERVNAVKFLHSECSFAVAQKRWTYIYDKKGVELHCLKSLYNVHSLEFLPRHFLLAALSNENMLSYLDVSTGEMVQQWRIKQRSTTCLTQNPANAILLSGNTKGVVCFWSPNSKEALVEILAHKAPISSVAVERAGNYMATTGLDRQLKIFDVRNYRELYSYKLPFPPTEVKFSQTRNVAVACGQNIHVYEDAHVREVTKPYMVHRAPSAISSIHFCPYEDILGIGHTHGFESIIVPGSGDPNIDALSHNPYESKSQRREREVKALLEKLQPEMITLKPGQISQVYQPKR